MANRSIDYYIKNLDIETRQNIFSMLKDVNPSIVKRLLEKEEGYPSWRRIGLKDDGIAELVSRCVTKFSSINQVMIENERPPLFEKGEDSYGSAQTYVNLLKEKTEEELKEEFGCSWEDYVPEIYQKKTNDDLEL